MLCSTTAFSITKDNEKITAHYQLRVANKSGISKLYIVIIHPDESSHFVGGKKMIFFMPYLTVELIVQT